MRYFCNAYPPPDEDSYEAIFKRQMEKLAKNGPKHQILPVVGKVKSQKAEEIDHFSRMFQVISTEILPKADNDIKFQSDLDAGVLLENIGLKIEKAVFYQNMQMQILPPWNRISTATLFATTHNENIAASQPGVVGAEDDERSDLHAGPSATGRASGAAGTGSASSSGATGRTASRSSPRGETIGSREGGAKNMQHHIGVVSDGSQQTLQQLKPSPRRGGESTAGAVVMERKKFVTVTNLQALHYKFS